jgi:hypothetical protein
VFDEEVEHHGVNWIRLAWNRDMLCRDLVNTGGEFFDESDCWLLKTQLQKLSI